MVADAQPAAAAPTAAESTAAGPVDERADPRDGQRPATGPAGRLASVLRSPIALIRRVPDVGWAMIWLWLLLQPLSQVIAGHARPVVPAALGLAAFALLYLVIVVGAYARPPHLVTRVELLRLLLFAALGLALTAWYGRDDASWLPVMLYVATAGGAVLSLRAAAVWTGAVAVLLIVVGEFSGLSPAVWGWTAFGSVLGSSLVITVRQMRGYIYQLVETRAELARTVVNEERLRFSRDLHELLGHTLTLIVVKAQVVRRLGDTDPAAAMAAAADIERIGRQALRDVREAVTGYRGRSFATELEEARAALSDAGITLRVTQEGTPLPPGMDAILSVVLREGITNVLRHSRASELSVLVRNDSGGALLELIDDGTGGQPGGTGNGLRGLTERLDAVAGSLTTGPGPTGGFRLAATLPALLSSTSQPAERMDAVGPRAEVDCR